MMPVAVPFSSMSELAAFLAQRGYVALPLRRSAVGHFHTPGTLNGRPVEILVDTGASCTVVSLALVQALGLAAERADDDAGGAGGAIAQFIVQGAELCLGAFAPRLSRVAGMDFEHVNAALVAQGSSAVDMILGVDVFDHHAAIIDYAGEALFLNAMTTPRDGS
jgi:predicted aspartyl protease